MLYAILNLILDYERSEECNDFKTMFIFHLFFIFCEHF